MISFTQTLRWAAAAAFLAYFVPSIGWTQSAPQKTLRFIPQAELRSIDPIWTTAYVTRNFGYLVFDTRFALDKDFKPQPQMVDRWTASDDKLSYSFVLRDGLKWHDGQPVRAADCIASVERWGKRDTLGQKLMEAVGEMQAVDDKTFTIKLKSPFPLTVDPLGNHGILRFNHVQPPFNNLKLRQAVLNLVDRKITWARRPATRNTGRPARRCSAAARRSRPMPAPPPCSTGRTRPRQSS